MQTFNLKDFGALGDGKTLDTAAFAAAVKATHANGGGKLIIPAGHYLTGTVKLTSNIELHLASGAVIEGSGNPDDYFNDTSLLYDQESFYLFWGQEVKNVTFSGSGKIFGNGKMFWETTLFVNSGSSGPKPDDCISYDVYQPKLRRPRGVIYFSDSENIVIQDITIVDAPAYTVWCIGCKNIKITGLKVNNDRRGPNADVLDIDCCCEVSITDCDLNAGDDCIALKSDLNRTGTTLPCENIEVKNCRFSSATCAIRIGYEGDAPIRNCLFKDIEITDTRHGIDILSVNPELNFPVIKHGTPIDNIRFENIKMRNVGQAFFVWAGKLNLQNDDYTGHIRNLEFFNIDAECVASSWIGSQDDTRISDLSFNNIKLKVDLSRDYAPTENIYAVPSLWGGNFIAGGLALRHITGLVMQNVEISVNNSCWPDCYWSGVKDFIFDKKHLPINGENTNCDDSCEIGEKR